MSDPVAYSGKLPCNQWSIAETHALVRLVIKNEDKNEIIAQFRTRFSWDEISTKIDRLIDEGWLTSHGNSAR